MVVNAVLSKGEIVSENSEPARDLFNKGSFGALLANRCVKLSVLETVYLAEKRRLEVLDARKKPIPLDALQKKAAKLEKNFWTRYPVFKDFRNRGYVIKTALKFGADFRVYDRGKKAGEAHAKWAVFAVHESDTLTWHDFAAKNRVAHSTKKKLLIGVVDDEGDVSYWEVRWVRP